MKKTKNKVTLLKLLCVVMIMSGCATTWIDSTTEITKDGEGKIILSKHIRSVKGLSGNDPETAQTWADADKTARTKNDGYSSTVNVATVFMANKSFYPFEVTDSQFQGIALSPGQTTSYSRIIPTGVFTFELMWADKNGKLCRWKTSRVITSDTKLITIKNVIR